MPKLDRDGVNIYYETHGAGPVILLTHGYSATSQMWRGQIEPLSRNHTLVLWDMRGHGVSDYPEDPAAYSETATVADCFRLTTASTAFRMSDANKGFSNSSFALTVSDAFASSFR